MSEMYCYEMLKRPFSIGSQPKGVIKSDDSMGVWGYIWYDRKLSNKEIDDYELKYIVEV